MRIGIIGSGVAGQAAAIFLARAGHEVTVLERFESARPLGAGLLLQPSGLAVLERLGLRAAVEACGALVHELDGRLTNGRRVLDLSYPKDEYGLGIHRGALFRVLHEAMLGSGASLRLNFEAARIEDAARPAVVSREGERAGPFDLVLDCAGAHDGVRDTLGLRVRAPLYPFGALWATSVDEAGTFAGKLHQRFVRAHTMIGILPIGKQEVAFFWSLKCRAFEAARDAGLDTLKERVLAVWPEAAPVVNRIARFDELALATYRDVRVTPWRAGRVLVIGDAAHGTSPQLGQGANLALVDALMLSHFLRGDVDDALARFERARRPHAGFYRLASWAITPMFQSDSRLFAWTRDHLLAHAGKLPFGRRMMRTTLAGTRKLPFGLWKAP
jgi:2-polyprenyl-6-methoxyphenol hydroxylase-like FAD-dependent oxidoreductase